MRILFIAMLFILMLLPAYAYTGDAQDTWPAFYGTSANGSDNGYMVFWDQNAAAYQAPRLIANDLLANQWSPQRNAIGWDTVGKWNVTFIEDANDLEIWESPDDDWQDDAGAWTRTAEDVSETWAAVDVETRQEFIWVMLYRAGGVQGTYIDLAAGAPAWVINAVVWASPTNNHFSLILDRNLYGTMHGACEDVAGNVQYTSSNLPPNTWFTTLVQGSATSPQIVVCAEQRLWVLYIDSGGPLWHNTSLDQPWDPAFGACGPIYTPAGVIDNAFHATWLKFDDTIHVALVDFIAEGDTTLRYLRRTANEWTATVILLTVDSTILGDAETLNWPTITVDTLGNIMIYYILGDLTAGGFGDLQSFYLDAEFYANYTTIPPGIGNWVKTVNIDASGTPVEWVVAPDSIPIASDM